MEDNASSETKQIDNVPASPTASPRRTASARRSATNSARSDISGKKPLPPIGTKTADDEEIIEEFASVTESELVGRISAEGDELEESGTPDERPTSAGDQTVEDTVTSGETSLEIETQTDWSWIETMKLIEQHEQVESKGGRASVGSKSSKAGTNISQESHRQSVVKELDGSVAAPTNVKDNASVAAERSITTEAPAEVMASLIFPYRDDEYGVPVLQLSDSDDSDTETVETASEKAASNTKTLPSIGPPQILQYKRDEKVEQKRPEPIPEDKPSTQSDQPEETINVDVLDSVNDMITFSGDCEFCNKAIKPFPTLHQQQCMPPQELYCCEEFAEFVRLAILPPPPDAHLIDIKPHAHFGSKQARAAAREKAQARMREREIQKQTVASTNNAASGGTAAPAASQSQSQGAAGAQMGGGASMFALSNTDCSAQHGLKAIKDNHLKAPNKSKSHKHRKPRKDKTSSYELVLPDIAKSKYQIQTSSTTLGVSNSQLTAKDCESISSVLRSWEKSTHRYTKNSKRRASASSLYDKLTHLRGRVWLAAWFPNISPSQRAALGLEDARAMKTINFQLSSQKCIDEGYVVRPPSPLTDQLDLADPFEVEPVNWVSGDLDDLDESAFETGGVQVYRKECVERFYPDGSKFLTMFSDGTGCVYYANGQLAISVSSIERGRFSYLVYDVQPEEDLPQTLLADFEPDANAGCYYKTGDLRLYLDQVGGLELHTSGAKKKKWNWRDPTAHVHAPPFQPLCFALNRYVGIRVMNQDNIAMTFLNYERSCRFNVGVKLKLVHPENLPINLKYDENQIFMEEKSNHISELLDKIETLLKYPHSHKADKIPAHKRITLKAGRIEKHKQQMAKAIEKDRKRRQQKHTRVLPPLGPQTTVEPVMLTETDLTSSRSGRPPKYPVVVVN